MAEFLGGLERLAADLYPYRWPIAAGVLLFLAAFTAFGYRHGWHTVVWRLTMRHRVPVAVIGTPLLALLIFVGYDLGSPLFTNKTVKEEFPFAFSAEVPENMDRDEVEMIMAGMAKVDLTMDEAMPDMMKMGGGTETASGDGQTPSTGAPEGTETGTSDGAADPADTTGGTEQATGDSMTEPEATQPAPVMLKSGDFHDVDNFHRGSGVATIYRGPDGSHLLRLEDLDVTNGPDLHVILSPHPDPERRGEVKEPGYVDLGKLKGNRGDQNYPIPADVDVTAQRSVVIYCKPFHVLFSVAPLQDAG